MNTFKHTKTLFIAGRNLHLFNQPFSLTLHRSKMPRLDMSYCHQPEYEKIWHRNGHLLDSRIVVVESDEPYTHDAAYDYIKKHNGIGLSRNNLFMLPELFRPRMFSFDGSVQRIIAPYDPALLPIHPLAKHGKICPMLILHSLETHCAVSYDVQWAEGAPMEKASFAFMKPLRKP